MEGVPKLQRFQDYFTEYKIVVYGGLQCADIIFEGKVTSEMRVNLLLDDVTRHYHVIANLTGSMCKQYICARVVTQASHTSVRRLVQSAFPFQHA